MHPDEAVQLAMQDLRTRAPNAARPALPETSNRALDLLRAWFSPLRTYATARRLPAVPAVSTREHPAAVPEDALLPLAVEACR